MQRWQLKQICFPAGMHQPKRVPFKAIYTPPIGIIHSAWSQFHGGNDFLSNRKGNLDNDEYRLYMGDISPNSKHAQCRICSLSFYNIEDRKAHHKKVGCYQLAVRAYCILLCKGHCVICDKPTKGRKWGVPLCPGEAIDTCIDRWKFYMLQPKNMREAIPNSAEPKPDVKILSCEDY